MTFKTAYFALGQITYSQAVKIAVAQNNHTLVELVIRHLSGNWGESEAADKNDRVLKANGNTPLHDDIESRYRLTDGKEVVIITHYVHSPGLRWTDICLADEVVNGQPVKTNEMIEQESQQWVTALAENNTNT